jgi:hypothetical protein
MPDVGGDPDKTFRRRWQAQLEISLPEGKQAGE